MAGRTKPWENGVLQASKNKRYLTNGDIPFFWMGDTAWLLFPKLSEEESWQYLKNRKDKAYNVIQATLIHTLPAEEQESSSLPSAASGKGHALVGNDFASPNIEGDFWTHVDKVIAMAEELGMYMALLPAWGSMVKQGLLNLDNAEAYGSFLSNRYGQCKNVIWLIGGDVRGSDGYDVFMKLGTTIKNLCPDQLMGYHPFGRTSSSLWFNEAQWLDFHMFQSGHRRYDQNTLGAWDDNAVSEDYYGEDSWRYVRRDYRASIPRPTLDGEPSYEQIPQGLHDPSEPYWEDHDVRRYGYWSVLEGACGHTYGHNAVMQFYQERDQKAAYGVRSYWHQGIHDPGAGQMKHLYDLMTAVDFTTGKACEELLADGQKSMYDRVSVFAGEGFAYFYNYTGRAFSVDMEKIKEEKVSAYWFDPISGVYSYFGDFECVGIREFIPPVKPLDHNDWVLVLKKK